MAQAIQKIDRFHETRKGKLVFAAIELLVAFGFSVWAVDTGELWQHGLAIVFFIGGVRNLFNAIHINNDGKRK